MVTRYGCGSDCAHFSLKERIEIGIDSRGSKVYRLVCCLERVSDGTAPVRCVTVDGITVTGPDAP